MSQVASNLAESFLKEGELTNLDDVLAWGFDTNSGGYSKQLKLWDMVLRGDDGSSASALEKFRAMEPYEPNWAGKLSWDVAEDLNWSGPDIQPNFGVDANAKKVVFRFAPEDPFLKVLSNPANPGLPFKWQPYAQFDFLVVSWSKLTPAERSTLLLSFLSEAEDPSDLANFVAWRSRALAGRSYYKDFYALAASSGANKKLLERTARQFPPPHGQERLPSAMHVGEGGMLKAAGSKLQTNGIENEFVPHVGKKVRDVPAEVW